MRPPAGHIPDSRPLDGRRALSQNETGVWNKRMTSAVPGAETEPKPGTRERLLNVAERMFAEQGFTSASVREITEAAGTNLGALNYHFHSKENLYAEVFSRRFAHLHEQFFAGLRNDRALMKGSLNQALASFAKAFMAPYADPEYSRRFRDLCVREMIEGQLPPGLFEREFITPMIEMIMGILQRARPGLDEDTVRNSAHSFLAQLFHVVKGAQVSAGASGPVPVLDERLAHVVRFTAAAIRHI
jgi:AcrR family transcriptional regulator